MTVADLIERLVRIPDWSMLVGISDNDWTILSRWSSGMPTPTKKRASYEQHQRLGRSL
jgi:hypothetical protein